MNNPYTDLMLDHQVQEDYHFNEDGSVVFETNQHIGQDYWDQLKQQQENFSFRFNGLTPVASIPEGVVNRWLREGFDFWSASAREIQDKLRKDQLEKMMVTQKTF